MTLPTLRVVVQCAGGLYLFYVAVRLWRSQQIDATGAADGVSPLAAFRMGFLTNILNPKSALFFGSVFATALPSNPSAELLAASVALVLVNALVWHLI
ncbi:LysE family transporter [Comamonas sp. w2-DMI]|uniref:LysE family translocator n=1 Tax=Comamonas sp. w2-DMI TaxID=3126391 RepID=UPI0032E4DF05